MAKYDICVLSVPEDARIAHTLADSIHRYRLPRGTVLKDPSLGYRRIHVDCTGSEFDDDVKALLDDSRCLLLICSPRTKYSPAILSRLTYFKSVRRDEDVIAVIADGEPIDSFPEAFIEKKMVQHIMPDMHIVEREETIEPIASDLRGNTPARRRELLRYETVRITASVLGLHPDDLKQRHRHRRNVAIATVATIVSVTCLATAVIFIRLGLEARHEGQILEQQTTLSLQAANRLKEDLIKSFEGTPEANEAVPILEKAIAEADAELSRIDALARGEE